MFLNSSFHILAGLNQRPDMDGGSVWTDVAAPQSLAHERAGC